MQTQTFNIALPKELVKKADKFAKQDYRNRSEYIRDLIVRDIKKRESWDEIFRYGKSVGKKMGIKSEQQAYDIFYEYRHGRKPPKSRT